MPRHLFDTALGPCSIAWEGGQVTRLGLLSDADSGSVVEDVAPAPDWVLALAERVCHHLAGQPQDFSDVPYAWHQVSGFQRQVYAAALRVKSGQTATYGQLAGAAGLDSAAARAVGTALGRNPWPLLVPCHRFVGANGRMTGFSAPGGITTKLKLLALEGSELFSP